MEYQNMSIIWTEKYLCFKFCSYEVNSKWKNLITLNNVSINDLLFMVTCGFIKWLELRTQLSGGCEGVILSLSLYSFNLQSLADVREILWSLQRFLLPKNQVDRKGAERSFLSLCLCGTSRNKPHSAGQCAKWVARSKNTKKPSSSVVWARARGYVVGGWGGFGLHWN